MQSPPLGDILAIVGPTASGKSAFSMELARLAKERGLPIEIISMDSALVYRGMDIGTAKPSTTERNEVIHHGIDIREPWEPYSAAQFTKDVHAWINTIRHRNAQPVIVGGTMLYWRALMQGLSDLPATTPEIRLQIDEQAQQIGWEKMHEKLLQIDPITAKRLAPGDSQRIGRALEIFTMTGKPMSELIAQSPYGESRDQSRSPHLLVSFEPEERSWLHERIAQRFYTMLDQGFIAEVKTLMQQPQMHAELSAMRAVGYRQAWEYLQQRINYEQFVAAGIAATRQLGKRQLTWLRAMPSRYVVNAQDQHSINDACQKCLAYLSTTKIK